MCRWFAYISDTEPCLLEDVLIRPAHSLTKQVHSSYLPHLFHHTTKEADKEERKEIAAHNIFTNSDGTGVVHYTSAQNDFIEDVTGLRPMQYRTIQPPLNDPNFVSLCNHSASTAVLAHIRMATSVVQPFNNHPFIFGRHSFMHNGAIASFSGPLRLELCKLVSPKAYTAILGSTDSEHLAALYFTYLASSSSTPNGQQDDWSRTYSTNEMVAALTRTVQSLLDLQATLGITTPNSLNLCTTDGEKLVALRFRNTAIGDEFDMPPSLYVSTTAGATLNRKYMGHPDEVKGVHSWTGKEVRPERQTVHGGVIGSVVDLEAKKTSWEEVGTRAKETHGKHVIVASEPSTFDQDEWELVGKNEFVVVEKDMSVRREAIKVKY